MVVKEIACRARSYSIPQLTIHYRYFCVALLAQRRALTIADSARHKPVKSAA